jgi:hypothetical protein
VFGVNIGQNSLVVGNRNLFQLVTGKEEISTFSSIEKGFGGPGQLLEKHGLSPPHHHLCHQAASLLATCLVNSSATWLIGEEVTHSSLCSQLSSWPMPAAWLPLLLDMALGCCSDPYTHEEIAGARVGYEVVQKNTLPPVE